MDFFLIILGTYISFICLYIHFIDNIGNAEGHQLSDEQEENMETEI